MFVSIVCCTTATEHWHMSAGEQVNCVHNEWVVTGQHATIDHYAPEFARDWNNSISSPHDCSRCIHLFSSETDTVTHTVTFTEQKRSPRGGPKMSHQGCVKMLYESHYSGWPIKFAVGIINDPTRPSHFKLFATSSCMWNNLLISAFEYQYLFLNCNNYSKLWWNL